MIMGMNVQVDVHGFFLAGIIQQSIIIILLCYNLSLCPKYIVLILFFVLEEHKVLRVLHEVIMVRGWIIPTGLLP